MKLIIDIDEESKDRLNDICNSGSDIPLGLQAVMMKAIANGTPLPLDLYKKPQTETDYTVSDRTQQIER